MTGVQGRTERLTWERAREPLPAFAVAAMLAMVVTFHGWLVNLELGTLARLACALALVCYVAVAMRASRGTWSLGPMLLLLVLLFHFGDLAILAVGADFAPNDADYVRLWLFGPLVPEAIYMCVVAVASFTLVYIAVPAGCRTVSRSGSNDEVECRRGETFAGLGAMLVISGIAVYFLRAYVVAPDLLGTANYDLYNQVLGGDRILSLATLAIVVGLVLAAGAPKSPARRSALLAFLGFAGVLLPLGVRTAILFPAAAGAVAMARNHKMPNGWKTLAVIVAGLALVGLVRGLRTDGGAGLTMQNANPVTALAEMGGTLRPVVETVRWREEWGEDEYRGLTYAAPVLRLSERVMGQPTPVPDQRLASVLMQQRVAGGQFGYSAVAEAFLNFGRWGVAVVFGLLALAAAWVDRWRRGGMVSAAVAGVLMAGVGLTVRNTFISLPSTILAGLLAIAIATVYARSTGRGE